MSIHIYIYNIITNIPTIEMFYKYFTYVYFLLSTHFKEEKHFMTIVKLFLLTNMYFNIDTIYI